MSMLRWHWCYKQVIVRHYGGGVDVFFGMYDVKEDRSLLAYLARSENPKLIADGFFMCFCIIVVHLFAE